MNKRNKTRIKNSNTVENTTNIMINQSSQDTSKDNRFESAKQKIEFISVLLALVAVIGTGFLKIISYGQVLYYSFDLEYCEFSLSQKDFIIFVSLLFWGGIALLYCILTDSIRKKITSDIMSKLKKIVSHIIAFLVNLLFLLFLPVIVLLVGKLFLPSFMEIQSLFNECICFMIIVMGVTVLFWSLVGSHTAVYLITCIIVVLGIIAGMTKQEYIDASTKKNYDIIECSEGNSIDYYVVISKGEKYSAYKCSIISSNNKNKLIVYTNVHRYFPIDSVSTTSIYFEEYNKTEDVSIQNTITSG